MECVQTSYFKGVIVITYKMLLCQWHNLNYRLSFVIVIIVHIHVSYLPSNVHTMIVEQRAIRIRVTTLAERPISSLESPVGKAVSPHNS